MTNPLKVAGVLGSAFVMLAAAACTEKPEEDGGTGGTVEVDLVDMLNESARLESDLGEAEKRIIRNCLEEAGFTVHDEQELFTPEPLELDQLAADYYPHESYLPDAEEAAQYGFGMWTEADEAWDSGEAEEYLESEETAVEDSAEIDNSGFEALSMDDRKAWYTAYVGAEKAEAFEEMLTPGGVQGAVTFEAGEDPFAAEPGGCEREMIESLYGEPERVEHTEEGSDIAQVRWLYRPENPSRGGTLLEEVDIAYAESMVAPQDAFVTCLDERGLIGWEFTEWGSLPISEYFVPLYREGEEEFGSDTDVELPDPPADLPPSYEGKKAFEIEVAVDFTECDAEVGFSDASVAAYDEAYTSAYLALEEPTYAWQEEMREAITRAQELIGT